jgi:hypothetical protein
MADRISHPEAHVPGQMLRVHRLRLLSPKACHECDDDLICRFSVQEAHGVHLCVRLPLRPINVPDYSPEVG